MKVLVTGANGQLGSELSALAEGFSHIQFLFCSSADLNITNKKSVDKTISEFAPQWVINTAAYTAVDLAETETEKAFEVNETGVEYLVEACREVDASLLHVSTDFVFDGNESRPYTKDDATFPLNVYGKSKLAGEQVARSYDKAIVLRTAWVFSSYGKNFVKTMLRLGAEREELNVVVDQVGAPTYAADLAAAILEIIQKADRGDSYGLYHYTNAGQTTWYHFSKEIMKEAGLNCVVHPITSGSYPTAAARPRYSILDTEETVKHFGLTQPDWELALKECIKILSNVDGRN